MPSHDEGSTDGLDVSEFDLATSAQSPPQQQKKYDNPQYIKQTLDPDFSDSDEEDIAGIHFQSSHFNGDSSDEEEEKAFTQGLTFSEVSQLAQNPSSLRKTSESAPGGIGEILSSSVMHIVSKNISNLGSMGQSLLSTVISSGTEQQEPKKQAVWQQDERASSDDSEEDFEMISRDDLS
jgi:hypothetical protein